MTARRQPPKVPRPEPVRRAVSPTIERLAADPSPAAVAAFWERAFPLVEPAPPDAPAGQVLVTFCWRDAEAEEVLLFANRVTDETRLADSLMHRVPGTDVWHLGYVMEPDWRASYSFLVRRPGESVIWTEDTERPDHRAIRAALDAGVPDPLNPDTCRNRASGPPHSVIALPQAPSQPWTLPRTGVPAGELAAGRGPDDRTLWWYAARGAGEGAPLLVVLDGEAWTSFHSLPTTLDNMVHDGALPPVRAVFLDSGGHAARWAEMGDADGRDATVDYVLEHLLPLADERGWLPADPARVACAGQSLGGLSSLRLALRHPERCGVALSQSASLWLDDLTAEVAALADPAAGPRVHLSWGRQEWVLAPPNRAHAALLAAAGVAVRAAEYNGGHDYAWWRGALPDGLVWAWGATTA